MKKPGVAKWASSQMENNIVTDKTFDLLTGGCSLSAFTYTSFGFTTEVDKKLVLGKQSHFHFDQSKKAIILLMTRGIFISTT